ncbi:MAG: 2-polyprenyl-3-methyl-6-methoxy-1,4-benzoquinone monooxygenase [Proteobacteria bacterium]|nr:2-polyprenyl-3-methyl-6-methoxy-1,4-benzoquinone monooxygenase [Pseudomonadota bacterium]
MLSVHNEAPAPPEARSRGHCHPRPRPARLPSVGAILRHRDLTGPPVLDTLLSTADDALRTLSGTHHASRPCPRPAAPAADLDTAERRRSGALMRVNHVGEVCAQALYSAQALATRDAALRTQFEHAGREETDHLAWTRQRLHELGARPSLLNPLWYGGAFAIGLLAGRIGDAASLGFLAETERQVERHLESHLERLPAADTASRAVVRQMREDEARHADMAERAGAAQMPAPLRWAMRLAAGVMTRTAHHL